MHMPYADGGIGWTAVTAALHKTADAAESLQPRPLDGPGRQRFGGKLPVASVTVGMGENLRLARLGRFGQHELGALFAKRLIQLAETFIRGRNVIAARQRYEPMAAVFAAERLDERQRH